MSLVDTLLARRSVMFTSPLSMVECRERIGPNSTPSVFGSGARHQPVHCQLARRQRSQVDEALGEILEAASAAVRAGFGSRPRRTAPS